jgi:hypothetical protein
MARWDWSKVMGAMSDKATAAYAQMVTAVLEAVERVGPDGIDKAALVAKFTTQGISRTTAYRWLAEIMESGQPLAHLHARVAEATAARAASAATPAADAAREGTGLIPRPPSVMAAIAGGRHGDLSFMSLLEACIGDAQQILAFARTEDGRVRNARLILAASQHMRQTLETAAKIQQSVLSIANIDEFHNAILAELSACAPEVGEKVVQRLRQLVSRWAPGGA